MEILPEPTACPQCGSCMDVYMDHSSVCSCGGDRTLRHNALRDLTCIEASIAGLRPKKEKQNLLPPRPDEEFLRGERPNTGRRPADIWLPIWNGKPAALDFACTSGMQASALHTSAVDGQAAMSSYEEKKRSFQGTELACETAGFAFIPLVIESHGGGWAPTATKFLKSLAAAVADKEGRETSQIVGLLRQRLSITLQRENARAMARRLEPSNKRTCGANPNAWTIEFQ